MLKNRNFLKNVSPALRAGLIAAAVALVPLTEAVGGGTTMTTTTSLLPYVPGPVSRVCDVTGSGGDDDYRTPPVSARIIAGPLNGSLPDLTRPFPVAILPPESATGCPVGMDKCLRWDYTWIYSVSNYPAVPPTPTYAVVAVDSDVNVSAATAPLPAVITSVRGDSVTGYGVNKAGEIGLRFPSSGQTFYASFFTPPGVGVGTMTAGFSAKKSKGFCAIAGADNPTVVDTVLSKPLTLTTTHNFTGGTCTAQWTQSPDGCVSEVVIVPPSAEGCQAVASQVLGNTNSPITGATCPTEVGGGFGSTQTCKWNSMLRTFTCVSLPSP
jgi:hypothetical protein